MSTQRKPEYVDLPLSEKAVHDYLADNPEFFERHDRLLGSLRLPHVTGGTVSLLERQVSMLRQKDLKLERKLKDLLSVARANDTLASKIHELTLQLLAAPDLKSTLEAIENALRSGFGADHSVLVLFGDPVLFSDVRVSRFFRPVERSDKALSAFRTFLEGSHARCGQVRDVQREFLFRNDGDDIGSVALVPLGRKSETGFLAIGSVDANRYNPGMSIDFLQRLGDLVAAALHRY